MKYYPVFLDISGKKCVIVGGGRVAERKALRLVSCGADVLVVSRKTTPLLEEMQRAGKIAIVDDDYARGALDGAFLTFAATNNAAVNRQVALDARADGAMTNVADAPDQCDFIVPSVMERGDLTIAVSTGGRSPALAKKIRKELEAIYGEEYSELLRIMGELRKKIMDRGNSSEENRDCLEAAVYSELIDIIRAGGKEEINAFIRRTTGVEMEAGSV